MFLSQTGVAPSPYELWFSLRGGGLTLIQWRFCAAGQLPGQGVLNVRPHLVEDILGRTPLHTRCFHLYAATRGVHTLFHTAHARAHALHTALHTAPPFIRRHRWCRSAVDNLRASWKRDRRAAASGTDATTAGQPPPAPQTSGGQAGRKKEEGADQEDQWDHLGGRLTHLQLPFFHYYLISCGGDSLHASAAALQLLVVHSWRTGAVCWQIAKTAANAHSNGMHLTTDRGLPYWISTGDAVGVFFCCYRFRR